MESILRCSNRQRAWIFEPCPVFFSEGILNETKLIKSYTNRGWVRWTRPDLVVGEKSIIEIKRVNELRNTTQLQAQVNFAGKNGRLYRLIVAPNTDITKAPTLLHEIEKIKGVVQRFNPTTGMLETIWPR